MVLWCALQVDIYSKELVQAVIYMLQPCGGSVFGWSLITAIWLKAGKIIVFFSLDGLDTCCYADDFMQWWIWEQNQVTIWMWMVFKVTADQVLDQAKRVYISCRRNTVLLLLFLFLLPFKGHIDREPSSDALSSPQKISREVDLRLELDRIQVKSFGTPSIYKGNINIPNQWTVYFSQPRWVKRFNLDFIAHISSGSPFKM